jgi:hypothetical protein
MRGVWRWGGSLRGRFSREDGRSVGLALWMVSRRVERNLQFRFSKCDFFWVVGDVRAMMRWRRGIQCTFGLLVGTVLSILSEYIVKLRGSE